MDPDQSEVHAHVPPADPARVAVPARGVRPDRNALADAERGRAVRADRLDHARRLVALDAREALVFRYAAHVAEVVVDVRPADADRLGPDEQFARTRLAGLGHVDDPHRGPGFRDGRAHDSRQASAGGPVATSAPVR